MACSTTTTYRTEACDLVKDEHEMPSPEALHYLFILKHTLSDSLFVCTSNAPKLPRLTGTGRENLTPRVYEPTAVSCKPEPVPLLPLACTLLTFEQFMRALSIFHTPEMDVSCQEKGVQRGETKQQDGARDR